MVGVLGRSVSGSLSSREVKIPRLSSPQVVRRYWNWKHRVSAWDGNGMCRCWKLKLGYEMGMEVAGMVAQRVQAGRRLHKHSVQVELRCCPIPGRNRQMQRGR